jgi:hypothetical protein
LQQRTADGAVAFLHSFRHASGQNYLIGGPDGIYDFECSANQVVPLPPQTQNGILFHTNHPLVSNDITTRTSALKEEPGELAKDQENSRTRLRSLEQRLTGQLAAPALAEIKSALTAHDSTKHPVCRPTGQGDWFTFASTIMTLSDPTELQVSPGPPDVRPYKTLSFTSRHR